MSCTVDNKEGAIEEQKVSMVPIGKVNYHNVLIGIFIDSSEKIPRRFFFEPVVLLDPKSIACQSHQIFKQEVVRFSIEMWNSELRSKVRDRVQSLPTFKHLEIHDDDIFAMPYEEVQLVLKPGSNMDQSIQLMDQPMTSFHRRSNESLDFYFICETQLTDTTLADNIREYPDFVLQKWKLALECRGLVLGNEASSKSLVVTINVSTLHISGDELFKKQHHVDDSADSKAASDDLQVYSDNIKINDDEKTKVIQSDDARMKSLSKDFKRLNQDLSKWMLAMPRKKNAYGITVFSVKKCLNPISPLPSTIVPVPMSRTARKSSGGCGPRLFPGLLGFSAHQSLTKKEHGDFHLSTGTFTVKTPGIYLFHFSGFKNDGFIWEYDRHDNGYVELKIDSSTTIAKSVNTDAVEHLRETEFLPSDAVEHLKETECVPVFVSALLSVKAGDKISAHAVRMRLHDAPPTYTTRYFGILFSDMDAVNNFFHQNSK